jgi:cysteine desulfurase / selenocysteine lyase
MAGFDVNKIREDFPILKTKMNGKPLIYLDNAATSQKPRQVINAVSEFYKKRNANIHRGLYRLAWEATEAYTDSKTLVAKFINAGSYRNIIYLRNTTEAINAVARAWGDDNVRKGDRILLTEMEHHSNIVPWQLLAKRKGATLDFVRVKDGKFIDIEDLKEKLEMKPKIFSFTHVSNVLATINDAKEMTRLAHKAGATVMLDAAQSVPHMKVDVRDIGCDFMAFSGHKMLGPSGIGVLYGKEDALEDMSPYNAGGDMIRSVNFQESTWNELPWKFEAGTQNIEGAIGLAAAIEYLNKLKIDNIRKHELSLLKHVFDLLEKDKKVSIYGPGKEDIRKRGGVIAFNIKGAHAHDVATIFDSEGIAIRSGHHCAMPLVTKVLNVQAVPRMSFYLYNTENEIGKAVSTISKVRKVLRIK